MCQNLYLIDGRNTESLSHCCWWRLECTVHSDLVAEHNDSTQLGRHTLAECGSLESPTDQCSEPMFLPTASEAVQYSTFDVCITCMSCDCQMQVMWPSHACQVTVTCMSCDHHMHITTTNMRSMHTASTVYETYMHVMWPSHAHHYKPIWGPCTLHTVRMLQAQYMRCTCMSSRTHQNTHLQSNLLCISVTVQCDTAASVTLTWHKPRSEALLNDKPWRARLWQQWDLSQVSWPHLLPKPHTSKSVRVQWSTTPTATFKYN